MPVNPCHAVGVGDDARSVNLTGAVALGIATDIAAAVEAVTGATATEIAALTTLSNWADGLSIDRLREVTALSQPGCARLVDRLVSAGFARRERDADDRRVTRVWITAAGRRKVAAASTARAAAVRAWLADLPAADRHRWDQLVEVVAGAHVTGPAEANRRCRLCDATACGRGDDCPVTRAVPDRTS